MKLLLSLLVVLISTSTHAGEVDVTAVKATKSGDGTYRFSVTLRHADTGWDHYANKWDVVAPDGHRVGHPCFGSPSRAGAAVHPLAGRCENSCWCDHCYPCVVETAYMARGGKVIRVKLD